MDQSQMPKSIWSLMITNGKSNRLYGRLRDVPYQVRVADFRLGHYQQFLMRELCYISCYILKVNLRTSPAMSGYIESAENLVF
jgi:hypothetical protein